MDEITTVYQRNGRLPGLKQFSVVLLYCFPLALVLQFIGMKTVSKAELHVGKKSIDPLKTLSIYKPRVWLNDGKK